MGLIEAIGRRRWRRRLRQHFAVGEDISTYAEVVWLGGSQRGTGLLFATQHAVYQPGASSDVRFAYTDIEDASFTPRGVGGNGVLRLVIADLGAIEFACRAPREFGPYVVERVRAAHR